jgi:hypothetical protein
MRAKRPNARSFALLREEDIILLQASKPSTLAGMLFDRAPHAGLPIGAEAKSMSPRRSISW